MVVEFDKCRLAVDDVDRVDPSDDVYFAGPAAVGGSLDVPRYDCYYDSLY